MHDWIRERNKKTCRKQAQRERKKKRIREGERARDSGIEKEEKSHHEQ